MLFGKIAAKEIWWHFIARSGSYGLGSPCFRPTESRSIPAKRGGIYLITAFPAKASDRDYLRATTRSESGQQFEIRAEMGVSTTGISRPPNAGPIQEKVQIPDNPSLGPTSAETRMNCRVGYALRRYRRIMQRASESHTSHKPTYGE